MKRRKSLSVHRNPRNSDLVWHERVKAQMQLAQLPRQRLSGAVADCVSCTCVVVSEPDLQLDKPDTFPHQVDAHHQKNEQNETPELLIRHETTNAFSDHNTSDRRHYQRQ